MAPKILRKPVARPRGAPRTRAQMLAVQAASVARNRQRRDENQALEVQKLQIQVPDDVLKRLLDAPIPGVSHILLPYVTRLMPTLDFQNVEPDEYATRLFTNQKSRMRLTDFATHFKHGIGTVVTKTRLLSAAAWFADRSCRKTIVTTCLGQSYNGWCGEDFVDLCAYDESPGEARMVQNPLPTEGGSITSS